MNFFRNVFQFIFSKRFLIHLGLLLMVYLIIIIGTIYYLDGKTNHGQKLEVQNYLGKNIHDVIKELETIDATYEIVDSIYDAKLPSGTILYQRPLPTEESQVYVKRGRKLFFRVSKNTKLLELPLLTDKSERYAAAILNNMGVKYIIKYVPSTEAVGAVLEQRYKDKGMVENQRIPINSTITLYVGQSYEKAEIQVPDFSCLTINEINNRLPNYAGLRVYDNYVNCFTKEDSLRARVVFQNPTYEEGKLIPGISTITVTLDAHGCN